MKITITIKIDEEASIDNEDKSVAVDHNYGGINRLRITDYPGNSIDNIADIWIFLKSDWINGRRDKGDYSKGYSRCDVTGHWEWPVKDLGPGDYCVIVNRLFGNIDKDKLTLFHEFTI